MRTKGGPKDDRGRLRKVKEEEEEEEEKRGGRRGLRTRAVVKEEEEEMHMSLIEMPTSSMAHPTRDEGELSESEEEEGEEMGGIDKDRSHIACPLCSKGCVGFYGLEHHFRKDHRNDDIPSCFLCDLCHKSYKRYSCLQKHKRLTHQRKVNSKMDGDASCPVCCKKFSGNYVLSDHLRLDHPEVDIRPFPCEICGLPNRTANALRNHKKKHLATRGTFTCEYCSMHFPKYTGLERHQKQRHGEVSESVKAMQPKDFVCPVKDCEERFSYAKHLDTHLETDHADDKTGNFECPICQRLFKTHRAMTAHKKGHFTTTPIEARNGEMAYRFPCDLCARRFEKWEGLVFHQRQVHQQVTEEAKALEKEINYGVQCPMCENYFKGNHALSQHIQKEHPDFQGILFSCDMCGLGFKHYARLRQHKTHKHNVPVKFRQGYLKANPGLKKEKDKERRMKFLTKQKKGKEKQKADDAESDDLDARIIKDEPIDWDDDTLIMDESATTSNGGFEADAASLSSMPWAAALLQEALSKAHRLEEEEKEEKAAKMELRTAKEGAMAGHTVDGSTVVGATATVVVKEEVEL